MEGKKRERTKAKTTNDAEFLYHVLWWLDKRIFIFNNKKNAIPKAALINIKTLQNTAGALLENSLLVF